MNPLQKVLVLIGDPLARDTLVEQFLRPAGYQVHLLRAWPELFERLQRREGAGFDLLLADETALPAAPALEQRLDLPVIYIANQEEGRAFRYAMRLHAVEVLAPPFNPDFVRQALQRAASWRQQWLERLNQQIKQTTGRLRRQVDELATLLRVGRTVLSGLDLDATLEVILDAAVELTEAEEAVLLLPETKSGELYIRAAKNLDDETVRTFRLPVTDSMAGQVLRSGKPFLLNRDTPEKIKTTFLVHSLVYVPLRSEQRNIGVLGVYHRTRRVEFTQRHVARLSALADFAALALQHAMLYARVTEDRQRLRRILSALREGVVVIDEAGRVLFFNPAARQILKFPAEGGTGRIYLEILDDPGVQHAIQEALAGRETQAEFNAPNERTYTVHAVPLSHAGAVVTLYDITHFKELDRAKTEFVNTVSHDLRSPLTAILGYVELLERAGPLNDLQKQFVTRVRDNVTHITQLITELLDLGRIEAGFDLEQEVVDLSSLLRYAVDGQRDRAQEKGQTLTLELPDALPPVLGNPVRLRQVFDNLIGNAVKYTQPGGRITVHAQVETGHILVRVADNGPGIPEEDLPHIFDKFYRASNVASEVPGTGLGLAIVKSVVERHGGRVWVHSKEGEGTTFTVLLPAAETTRAEQEWITQPRKRDTHPPAAAS